MKKIIFGSIAVLAIAAVAIWNLSLNSQQSSKLLDIALANIEALAQETEVNLPEVVIACDYPSCYGKQCHQSTYNWVCRCEFNGYTNSLCL